MRETSTPRAASKAVRLSKASSAASSAILPSRAKARSLAAASLGSPLMARNFSISARDCRGSEVCAPSAACSRKCSAISPIERRDQGGKQGDVAHADVWRAKAVMRRSVEPERQHFGIRRRRVRTAEGFDAGLQEFAAALGAMTEDRTEIAKASRLAG